MTVQSTSPRIELTQSDLRRLTQERLKDAECLLNGRRYDAAAYLCGYVLETALKACICKRLRVHAYPESELSGKFKTHALGELLLLAGLKNDISSEKHPKLRNWSVVSSWKPEWRYRRHGSVSRKDAEDMIMVLSKEILPWLSRRW